MADPSLIAKSKIEYAQPAPSKTGKGLGILTFIAFLFLVIVGLIYGGVYFYKQSLKESLDSLTLELSQLEEKLDPEVINEIVRVDRGLLKARSLLSQHIYTSNLFNLLEEHTLGDVYYTNFAYDFLGSRSVVLHGVTSGYVSLHRQLERLRSIPLVTDVFLDTIQIAEDGNVAFTSTLSLNENVFRFR